MAVEDVVAQRESDAIAAHEIPSDQECLGDTLGPGLLGVTNLDSEAASVAEQTPICAEILGSGDQQDLLDLREHQCG